VHGFVNYKKGCTRFASYKVYQLLTHGQWFSPDTPASSTTKTDHHDIDEILLKEEIMIGTTSSRILYQLRDKYTICRCCWNVATHKMESSQWEN
jgi:hypothetical protein